MRGRRATTPRSRTCGPISSGSTWRPGRSTSSGWSVDAAGRRAWPVTGYLDEGPRSTDWLAKGVIKQHRTIATYVNLLIGEGLALSHLGEWGPSADQVAAHPEWANERQRPPFLLVACRR